VRQVLLEGLEDLFRVNERQAEVLEAFAVLLQDHHIGKGFFMALVVAHNELDLSFMGVVLQFG
jgi:hypothetical protein